VVALIERALDLVGMRGAQQRDVVALGDERLGERGDDRLDAAVARRRDRDPRRGEHRDA
jgi:hypothetical protein